MNFLSGKKLRIVFFGLILVLVISFLASQPNHLRYGYGDTLLNSSSDRKAQVKALGSINKKDSDGDGLKDWEEELWRTDPNNPDTDGDGTKDGDEIDVGRNPNLSGPNDVLDTSILSADDKKSSFDGDGKLTATEKFSQDIFGNYLLKRVSGESLSEDDKNILVSSALQNISDLGDYEIKYTTSDINISADTSDIALKNYGNTLGNIIKKYSFETKSSVLILEDSLENNNPNEIKKLDPVIDGYKNILNDFLEVSAPESATQEHLDTVNALALMTDVIESMRVFYEDPIRALAGLGQYQAGSEMLLDAFQNMKTYFSQNGIKFEEKDGGYILVNII